MVIPQIAVVHNWRNEQNKSGLYSVHLRVTIDRISRYYKIPVPQKVGFSDWSGGDDCWVKNTHPFSFNINNKIRDKKNIVHDLIKRNYALNKRLSFEVILAHLDRKEDRNSFYDFMDRYIKKPPEKLEENTLKKYTSCLRHLKRFKKELFFSQIDNVLVQDFHNYMQTERKLAGAACKKYMEAFKKVIRRARKENYLDPSQMEYLFDDVKISVPKAKRTYLEPKEIKALKDCVFPENQKHLERDRDMFLFQIYTGYYYKDLFIFTKDRLIEDEEFGFFIIGARDKNGNQTIIPLFKFPYSAAIIRKYHSSEKDKAIFDPKYLIEEPVYNRHLKDIAKEAGITKSISNKVARHTNAQLWVRYGASRPVLSKMLGHANEKTTNNYFDIDIPEIVAGTKEVDFSRLGI